MSTGGEGGTKFRNAKKRYNSMSYTVAMSKNSLLALLLVAACVVYNTEFLLLGVFLDFKIFLTFSRLQGFS